jgi:hypothetical protein
MPPSFFIIALFVMFGGSAMSARRKFMLLGGLLVYVVHLFSYRWNTNASPRLQGAPGSPGWLRRL